MKHNPHGKLTLTECFGRFYDSSEFAVKYRRAIVAQLHSWERLMGSPKVQDVTNLMVAEWRAKMLAAGYAPQTIKSYWTTLRMVFRRIGPVFNGNPLGLGIIPAVPYMKPIKYRRKLPKRVPLDDLSRLYLAARNMVAPRRTIPAPDWWRCLLAVFYFTGLRRGDALKIRMEHINLDAGTLFIHVGKTGVEAELPLHPVLVEHIRRIWTDREFLFGARDESYFYQLWKRMIAMAGVSFRPHDIRRTACSEVDAAMRGMGKVLLLHSPMNVTEQSYLNSLPELRQAVERMEIPLAFKHGINMSDRQIAQERRQRIEMNKAKFAPPSTPHPSEFQWHSDGFMHGGRFCYLRCEPQRLLRTLVDAQKPLGCADLIRATSKDGQAVVTPLTTKQLRKRLWHLRTRLREFFGLPETWDPIATVTSGTWDRVNGTTYRLLLPPEINRGVA